MEVAEAVATGGVVATAHCGVHMAVSPACDWALALHSLTDEEELPEILVDPKTKTLSVVNENTFARVAIVSVETTACVGRHGRVLMQGQSVNVSGVITQVTTFIVLSPPRSIVDLCRLRIKNARTLKIDSHFSDSPHQTAQTRGKAVNITVFPLRSSKSAASDGSFLCTQSAGGEFTHFQHASTFHAIDFRCPIGTEVVAVCDGRVVSVGGPDGGALVHSGGIHVRDLFAWNSLVLEATAPDFSGVIFEYVHIHCEGVRVKAGDLVNAGDVLCLSGASGFCPEPHLHFEAHARLGAEEPSVTVQFRGECFEAGNFYSA
jgi:murein DD-endopeptidase MepM/ murein hydrolase activator NlpD